MATYYQHSSSNNPRDAAAMHYIREALPTSYSEVAVLPTNMMYMNYSSSSGSYSDALAGNAQQHHNNNCVEISDSTPTQQQEILSNNHVVEHDFSAWRDGRIRNEMLLGPASFLHAGQNLQAQGLSLSLGTQIPSPIQIPSIQYRNPNQGFTSFLSPNSSVSGEGGSRNGSSRDENSTRNADFFPLGVLGANQDSIKIDPSSYGMSSIERTVPHSKYLKAAQQLLDEVVNVGKALKQPDSEKNQNIHELWKGSKEADGGSKNGTGTPPASSNPQEPVSNSSSELSPAERQDLQNKMTKLLAMLDEVDRRYKQYYHQMQIVVSSFDAIAGSGAAKPYTALALQTISRHFRCLRDAITGQIRSTRRSLGEQDTLGNSKGVGISRLRYVDQQLRQQRAFQQLGMMQQHAWRPQRGLPESSVSILRAWLFEHFLHPYPKDSDKIMLARQTGLTRSQVSNWFINARVRLWKPMVEEMYKEEIGDADMDDSNSSSENAVPKVTKDDHDDDDDDNDVRTRRVSEERGDDFQQSTTSTTTGRFLDSKSIIISACDVEMGMGGARRGRASFGNGNGNGAAAAHDDTQTEYGIVKLTGNLEQRPSSMEECSSSLFPDGIVQSDGGSSDRFMAAAAAYHMSELGTFGSRSGSSGISLTLGLQHCEGGGGGGGSLPIPISIPMPIPGGGGGGGGGHHSFVGMSMSMRGPSDMYNPAAAAAAAAAAASSDSADFDCMDPGSQQHRFSSSSHLLHDFVA